MGPLVAPKRPDRNDDAVLEQAARTLFPDIKRWLQEGGESDPDEDEVVEQLAEALKYHDDGYEISKALEDRGWSPDARLVDLLDNAMQREIAFQNAVKQWVEQYQIKPTYQVGDKVRVKARAAFSAKFSRPAWHDGEISKIDAAAATYVVRVESLGHIKEGTLPRGSSGTYGFILPFEEVFAADYVEPTK
jgi:hypothetical protein